MNILPDTLLGHWDTPGGHDMATTYAAKARADLAMSDRSDLDLANAVFLADRRDLNLIGFQTAAKERIRWLSVQLALRDLELAEARRLLREAGGLIDDALTTHIYDVDNGDEVPDDCAYTTASEEIEKFLDGAPAPAKRVIMVRVEGGLVHEISCADPADDLEVIVFDFDDDCLEPERSFKVAGEDAWASINTFEVERRPIPAYEPVEDADDD